MAPAAPDVPRAPSRTGRSQVMAPPLAPWLAALAAALPLPPACRRLCNVRLTTLGRGHLVWRQTFDPVKALHLALCELQRHYKVPWLLGRQGSKTPAQGRHAPGGLRAEAMAIDTLNGVAGDSIALHGRHRESSMRYGLSAVLRIVTYSQSHPVGVVGSAAFAVWRSSLLAVAEAVHTSEKMPATVLGSGQQTSLELAAFANGVMMRSLDCNDGYTGKESGVPFGGQGQPFKILACSIKRFPQYALCRRRGAVVWDGRTAALRGAILARSPAAVPGAAGDRQCV
jgi:hypothetical protein